MNDKHELTEKMQDIEINSLKEKYLKLEDDEEDDQLVSQLNMDISNQYVVFFVEEEEYGVPILSVQEIISLPHLTRIPGVPTYIRGIINLRGNIIPLYELRSKLNLRTKEIDSKSVAIITQTGEKDLKTVGFIVDSVTDVVTIAKENFRKTPEFSNQVNIKFIEKIGQVGNRMIIIINLTDLILEDEKSMLENTIDGI